MLIGREALNLRLEVYQKNMTNGVADALRKSGGEVIRVAEPKTPIETGELRRRAFNEGPLKSGKNHVQVVGYEKHAGEWDKNRAYAVPVHENMQAKHPTGEAKFLEHAVEEVSGDLLAYMAKELKKVHP